MIILYTKNDNYEKINSVINEWIVNYEIMNEYEKYLPSHYSIKANSKKGTLLFMHWINKMHKNPVWWRFIIASPKCGLTIDLCHENLGWPLVSS